MNNTSPKIYVNNSLFLGRLDEQDAFRRLLRQILAEKERDAPPRLILLYGEGGMGKSQLVRRLLDIAHTEPPFERDIQTLFLDWEAARNRYIALQVAREQIAPEAMLAALFNAIPNPDKRHFKKYGQIIKRRKEAEQKIAQALDRERQEGAYADLADLGATALAKLVRLALPPVGETGEKMSQTLLAAGITLGAEQLAAARQKAEQFIRARLDPESLKVYRDPLGHLARALGDGYKQLAKKRPLFIALDTYEIIPPAADLWLREVIKSAGPRLLWLIAGRNNLLPSRPGDRFRGYSADFTRNLTAWDIQELAIKYVSDFLLDRAPQRPPTRDDAAAIHRATLGVPLALNLAADLWAQNIPLSAITKGTPDYAPREELVRLMCERVLVHVEKDPGGEADRRAIYALAMQARPDRAALRAILSPADPDAPFNLNARLQQLASRYAVVKETAALHDTMGAFVHEYLLRVEKDAGPLLRDIAGRAVKHLRAARNRLDKDLFDLAEKVEDEDRQQTTLDLIHWLFWLDERAAWQELIPRFTEALAYDLNFARTLLQSAAPFKPGLSKRGRKRLKALQLDEENRAAMLAELERLADRGKWLADREDEETAPQCARHRRAILHLWRARLQMRQKHPDAALQSLLKAEALIPPDAKTLRQQTGRAFSELSRKFLWPRTSGDAVPSEAGLQAARRAVALDSEQSDAWYYLGVASKQLKRYEEAEAAYRRAIELDETYAYPHNNLGVLYLMTNKPDEAARAFRRAVELEPEDASYRASLAGALRQAGREAEAAEHLARARQWMATESDYNKACIEALSGNPEAALDYLAQALAQGEEDRDWAKQDPDLLSLRQHPRFIALVNADRPEGFSNASS